MKRNNLIDGLALLGFALILTNLSGEVGEISYFGFISSSWMIVMLAVGAIFFLIAGASILLGKGHIWFD